jgi:serine/threonine protein kinase|eukprot:CAMPEP_0169133672 /NCGR_PEP_ID=MMETSP1015-20121227/39439_1 /TAXON_ID=342587 /ORGANISM="Karlodinium micrum, Strain CCMP2283" /LENGTH=396 /DNA_ID=CAMNT_0009198083 /DNA_START=65 /DNA_END=1255 /DNA_ORIENTATION=-
MARFSAKRNWRRRISHAGWQTRNESNKKMDPAIFSHDEESKVEVHQSKFGSLLAEIGSTVAGRYHVGPGKLEVDYDVSNDVVGSGCTGNILLARSKSDPVNLFAVKTYQFSEFSAPEDWSLLKNEMKLLLQSDHANVLRAVDIYENESALHIVTPFMAGGDLGSASLSPLQVAIAVRQMLAGVQFLHASGYIHRDIKPNNFVLDSDDDVKIIDFGLCVQWKPNGRRLYQQCGTHGFMSPEMCKGTGYTNKTDMWSLGVAIFYLLEGHLPFDRDSDTAPSQQEVDACIESCSRLDLRAKHFLKYLLKVDPSARPTAEQATSHPWFGCSFEDDALTIAALAQWERSVVTGHKKVSSDRWADMSDMSTDDEALGPWGTNVTKNFHECDRWVDLLSDDED